MATAFDLDAYLDRIGWNGGTAPTLDTLEGLLDAHMAAIPFENLDVLLGRPPRLDLESLQEKVVRSRRGGYCFEQATLLASALEALGYRPSGHAARVTMFAPRTEVPRTHMFLVVPVGERAFVVDPGFGLLAPRAPVPLSEGAEARFGADSFRMVREGPWWTLRVESEGRTVDAWASTLDADNAMDFAMSNHWTATFPASPFVNRIMMRALTPEGRVSVSNRDVTIVRGDEVRTTQLADRAELRALVAGHFGFDLPEIERMRVPSVPEWA